MLTYLSFEEVEDVLSKAKNVKTICSQNCITVCHPHSGSHSGLIILEKGCLAKNKENSHLDNSDDLLFFDLNVQPFLQRGRKEQWKKSISDFENGQKISSDVPDYVFICRNVSYQGSKDYFVIYENFLVKL